MFVVPKARSRKAVKGWQLVGRGKPSASPAKTPASAGNASKAELEALAARNGWQARELTFDEVQRMSSAELRFHEIWNKQELDAAFKREADRRASKERLPAVKINLMWSGHATPEEDQAAFQAGQTFASGTPTFPRTREAAILVANFMKDNLLDATRPESYTKAFNALVSDGKITPLPYQSADAFYNEHKELHPTQNPPLIQAKEAKAEATQEHFAKAQTASAKARSTTVTDYPREQHGVPPLNDIEKASLRQKVRSMSADELAAKCSTDPSFKKALDSLQ